MDSIGQPVVSQVPCCVSGDNSNLDAISSKVKSYGNGGFILSPDPSFNPNSAVGRGDWRRMRPDPS